MRPEEAPDQRRGVLTITTPLLVAALGLPTGTKILATKEAEAWRDTLEFVVWHPDLPITADGDPYPEVDLVVTRSVAWKVQGHDGNSETLDLMEGGDHAD